MFLFKWKNSLSHGYTVKTSSTTDRGYQCSYSNETILSHIGTQLKPPAHQIGVSNVPIQMRKFSLTWVHSLNLQHTRLGFPMFLFKWENSLSHGYTAKTSSTPDQGFQCSYSNEKILSHMGTQLKPPSHQIGVPNVSIQMRKFSLTWVHS